MPELVRPEATPAQEPRSWKQMFLQGDTCWVHATAAGGRRELEPSTHTPPPPSKWGPTSQPRRPSPPFSRHALSSARPVYVWKTGLVMLVKTSGPSLSFLNTGPCAGTFAPVAPRKVYKCARLVRNAGEELWADNQEHGL